MKKDRMAVEFEVCVITRYDVAMAMGEEGADETTAMSIAHALTDVEMRDIAVKMSIPLYAVDEWDGAVIDWLKREKKVNK